MATQIYISLFLIFFLGFTCASYGYQLNVGGKDGWVINPTESYSHWAQRLRFQVNDTVLFKYERGMDSVLEVEKDDFDNCNTSNPKTKMEDGNSIFQFDRSGPFYFITGNKTNCDKGQKLIVVVLAVRTPPLALPPAANAPVAKPPSASPQHRSFSSPAFTPSIVLVPTVSLVLSVAFDGFIGF
ncbi:early nodulin-like protein 2 [Olea europaea var. sylvestris]|uniref:early nodulin-like protein 2 n=1 Tax=Olea europaea var. sylvestris TaxID=158386 RepID=UPI000C1CDD0B|nr:early nodulin-like protein 2 [Olea europaea var. sylvestris]